MSDLHLRLLRELADLDPGSITADETPVCFFCGVGTEENAGYPAVPHGDECLWARARLTLGMEVPPAAPAGPPWNEPDEEVVHV